MSATEPKSPRRIGALVPWPDTEAGVRSPRLCALAGISYRQLDYWEHNGIVTPSVPATGSGSRRRYTLGELLNLIVVRQMLDAGASLQTAGRAVRVLNWSTVRATTLVVASEGSCAVVNSGDLLPLLRRVPVAFVVVPALAVAELEAQLGHPVSYEMSGTREEAW